MITTQYISTCKNLCTLHSCLIRLPPITGPEQGLAPTRNLYLRPFEGRTDISVSFPRPVLLVHINTHDQVYSRIYYLCAMSAKEFYHKSPLQSLHVPEIPPEVWTTILRHATWDSKFLFPSELTFESIGMSRSEHLRSFRKVLVSSYIPLQ
jgi:hypothetical protein